MPMQDALILKVRRRHRAPLSAAPAGQTYTAAPKEPAPAASAPPRAERLNPPIEKEPALAVNTPAPAIARMPVARKEVVLVAAMPTPAKPVPTPPGAAPEEQIVAALQVEVVPAVQGRPPAKKELALEVNPPTPAKPKPPPTPLSAAPAEETVATPVEILPAVQGRPPAKKELALEVNLPMPVKPSPTPLGEASEEQIVAALQVEVVPAVQGRPPAKKELDLEVKLPTPVKPKPPEPPAAPPAKAAKKSSPRDAETLRRCAWEIGERRTTAAFTPTTNHVALAYVSPTRGFAHWRILPGWVEQVSRQRGNAWHQCRMILRLYDVSCIEFNGFNAHRVQDVAIGNLAGQCFFNLPHGGTTQLAEAGFLLRGGEFIAAARSQAVQFPPGSVCPRSNPAALLVDENLHVEEVANVWEQERFLEDKRRPKVRKGLRIAAFAFEAQALGRQGLLPQFVSELAAGQKALGHAVHVFVPQSDQFTADREVAGVLYHPLKVHFGATPIETALSFAKAAERRIRELPPFDLFHLHEWMTGLAPWLGTQPTVLSMTSTESTRLNGAPPGALSLEIKKVERELLQGMECTLTPAWLREKVTGEFGIDGARVHAFPVEGRIPNEWETPLDVGKVKVEFGFGPLDRLLAFVGPLEDAAGPDILVEALPVVLNRVPSARVAFAGTGALYDHLHRRAQELGVAHAVKLLGRVDGHILPRLLRASEAVVLPSRQRVEFDEATVELARRAGRAVVVTHGGPAHLVRHEQTGLVTYDNAGSLVWAFDRILGDPGNTERMGRTGKEGGTGACSWQDVTRLYFELCAACFPELTQPLAQAGT